jgi:hypothetical protein
MAGPRYRLGRRPQFPLGGYAKPQAAPHAGPGVSTASQWLNAWQKQNPGMFAPGVSVEQAQAAVPGYNGQTGSGEQAWVFAALKQAHAGGGAPPSDGGAADGDTPFAGDSQYFADLARRNFEVSRQQAELRQQSAYDRTDLQEALRRMALKQTDDRQSTKEGANKQGLFFSGHLGKSLGDLDTAYARQQGDAQQGFDRREAARQAASAALDQGYSLDQAAGLAASADRKVQSDNEAALAGYLAPEPTPAQKPVAATGSKQAVGAQRAVTTTGFNRKRNQRYGVVNRGGAIFHTYAGGRPVRVG